METLNNNETTSLLLLWLNCPYVVLCVLYERARYTYISRAESRFAPSHWKTTLLCNYVSHWLTASLESAPYTYSLIMSLNVICDIRVHNKYHFISAWLWFPSVNPAIRSGTDDIWARGRNHYWTLLQGPSVTWDYYKSSIKLYYCRRQQHVTWASVELWLVEPIFAKKIFEWSEVCETGKRRKNILPVTF